jgi:hypothetical protein
MDAELVVRGFTPDPNFRWVTSRLRGEHELRVTEMKTNHLYYALRMIWNHTVHTEWQLGDTFVKYTFSEGAGWPRLNAAVPELFYELVKRTDLEEEYINGLNYMAACFRGQANLELTHE